MKHVSSCFGLIQLFQYCGFPRSSKSLYFGVIHLEENICLLQPDFIDARCNVTMKISILVTK